MTDSAWHERLKKEREKAWPKQGDAADALGLRREVLSRYESGTVKPGIDALERIAAGGIDVLYVITGRREQCQGTGGAGAPIATAAHDSAAGSRLYAVQPHAHGRGVAQVSISRSQPAWLQADTAPAPPTHPGGAIDAIAIRGAVQRALWPANDAAASTPLVLTVRPGEESGIDYHVIPKRMRPAAAGLGSAAPADDNNTIDLAGLVAVSREWLRHQVGPTPGQLVSVVVQGDSMAPTLHDGDTVLVAQSVAHHGTDGIYVLDVNGQTRVKRVQWLPGGGLTLISDNTRYQPVTLDPLNASGVRVIGRVLRKMVWPVVG